MSPELRGRVLHHTYDKWLSVVPFFQLKTDHLPATDAFLASTEFKGFVLSLANYVSPMLFVPFEVVMRANQFCTAL